MALKTKAVGILALISLVAIILAFFGFAPQEGENGIIEGEPSVVKIATFNIQIFGKTKRQKDYVVDVLTNIVREFDIVYSRDKRFWRRDGSVFSSEDK